MLCHQGEKYTKLMGPFARVYNSMSCQLLSTLDFACIAVKPPWGCDMVLVEYSRLQSRLGNMYFGQVRDLSAVGCGQLGGKCSLLWDSLHGF